MIVSVLSNQVPSLQRAKAALFQKFVDTGKLNKEALSAALEAHGRKMQAGDDTFGQLHAMCSAGDMPLQNLLVSEGFDAEGASTVVDCICSDGFDAHAADALFGGSGAATTDLAHMCTASCLPMVEVLHENNIADPLLTHRRLADRGGALGPLEDVGEEFPRRLQASPSPSPDASPSPSPDWSPSPSPDFDNSYSYGGDVIDAMAFFYCACELPEIVDGWSDHSYSYEVRAELIEAACRTSGCQALIEQTGEVTCPVDTSDFSHSTSLSFTATGTVDDYGPEARAELRATFAQMFDVKPSACDVEVMSGSVLVTVTIYTDDAAAADHVAGEMANLDHIELGSALASVTLADGSSIEVEAVHEVETHALDLQHTGSSALSREDESAAKDLPVAAIVCIAFGGAFLAACATFLAARVCMSRMNKTNKKSASTRARIGETNLDGPSLTTHGIPVDGDDAPAVAMVAVSRAVAANFCVQCGRSLVAGDNFCPGCGHEARHEAPVHQKDVASPSYEVAVAK